MTGEDRPSFLITIDTEGDDLWSRPRAITTENARHLFRFQALAESHGLKPTYLATYEMAAAPAFLELGKDILKRRTGEVGMHLHAWNTPPLVPLTDDDFLHRPYLIEYPVRIMEQKVAAVTDLLEERFGVTMVSHRAGRWSFNGAYARVLEARGYRVDCSVTPHVSWKGHRGAPTGNGGTDYSMFPAGAYFMDLDDISRPGTSILLEVPMTIVPATGLQVRWLRGPAARHPLASGALNRFFPAVHWLRPNGRNREQMLSIVRHAASGKTPYIEFMLHSSELMPGGSRRFPGDRHIEALYRDMDVVFAAAHESFVGATLNEYYDKVSVVRLQSV